jgi:uncharacterized protein YeaO (DUF488 family)
MVRRTKLAPSNAVHHFVSVESVLFLQYRNGHCRSELRTKLMIQNMSALMSDETLTVLSDTREYHHGLKHTKELETINSVAI